MKKKKKHQAVFKILRSVFPPIYPPHMGTPRNFPAGSAFAGEPGWGGPSAKPNAAAESVKPSRARFFHEMKKSLGLIEWGHNHSWSSAPNPNWGGFSVPNFGMVNMRQGGPTIGGPGFQNDGEGGGGRYDFGRSPGIGFKTEAGWRIWRAALQVMEKDKLLTPRGILAQAMAKAGVRIGQVDPSELRLVEMGIEWWLTDTGSLAAKRGGAYGPYSGGPTDAGGYMAGRGAP